MKKTAHDWALLGRVWAELGAGHITEAFIADKREFVDGMHSNGHITVNPVHPTVDTAIHEILHRLHPAWSENYVRRTTTYLRKRMSDEETQAFYAEFQKRARKRKRPARVED